MNIDSIAGGSDSSSIRRPFSDDFTVPKQFRATLSDYLRSSYSRGHLAPVAAHHGTQLDLYELCYLNANIVPQDQTMNSTSWSAIERWSRDMTLTAMDVRVVSGPLFIPNNPQTGGKAFEYKTVGDNRVAVPTHLFKVVYLENLTSPAISKINCMCVCACVCVLPSRHTNTPTEQFVDRFTINYNCRH
uniref:Endonuclease G, mitochondrial n=2 Tax=Lygus hesperus TaxID=30085 RepID=A0A0A9YCP5_LYGHE